MEQIQVIVSFNQDGVFPRVIRWGKHSYKILKVNLVHTIKEGAVRIYLFSVSDRANMWKLGFNTESLKWWIEENIAGTHFFVNVVLIV